MLILCPRYGYREVYALEGGIMNKGILYIREYGTWVATWREWVSLWVYG